MNKTPEHTSNRPLGWDAPSAAGVGSPGDGDDELVARARAGESVAYDALVSRHNGRIFAMIKNLVHNEADAWDLSQEVFIKAWRALPRFEQKARFSTWIFRIAHNVVYDWTRRRKIESAGELNDEIFQREEISSMAETLPAEFAAPDEALSRDELRAKIESALAMLSPEHRAAVVLKDVHGLAYKEIADVTGCTIGTVMSRLFYARQKLQLLLKDEYEAR
jgi:RNA polymerase sigma-70 factor (ECF subfamily)